MVQKNWIRARGQIIAESVRAGRIQMVNGYPEGVCEDCNRWKPLTPDHRRKRSQGGQHTMSNIDWVCWPCHDRRDNQGDPLKKKDRFKNKMKATCELCHKEEATGTRWVSYEESPIHVAGTYRVCENCGGPKKGENPNYGSDETI